MIISRLTTTNFKCYANESWQFAPGLNIIYGPNESGKTSIQEALILGLFGDATSEKKGLKAYQRWGSEEGMKITLDIQLGGERFTLIRDFQERQNAIKKEGRSPIVTRSEVQKTVSEAVGTPSETLYLSTACITHSNINDLKAQSEIGDSLRSVTIGIDDNAEAAIKLLDKSIVELEKGIERYATNPGEIKRTQNDIEDLKIKLQELNSALKRVETARNRATETRELIASLKEEKTNEEIVTTAWENKIGIEKELEELRIKENAIENRLEKIKQLNKTISELQKKSFIPSELNSNELLEKIRAAKIQAQTANEKAAEVEEIEEKIRSLRLPTLLCNIGIAVGTALFIIGVFLPIGQLERFAFGMIGTAICAAALIIRKRHNISTLKAQADSKKEDIRKLREMASDAEVISAVKIVDAPDLDSLVFYLEQREKASRELEKAYAELAGIQDGRSVEEIEAERRFLSQKRRDAEEKLAEQAPFTSSMSVEEYAKLKRKVDNIEQRVKTLETERTEAESLIKISDVDPLQVADLEEQLEVAEKRLESLTHRLKVCRTARDVLSQAVSEALADASPAVEVVASEYLSEITVGTYSKAVVKAKDKLVISVHNPYKRSESPPNELSQGTQDQLFFAARLGLAKYVFGLANPPIILDDPFVTFDGERLANALEILKNISSSRQVFLFTCRPECLVPGSHVIELEPRQPAFTRDL